MLHLRRLLPDILEEYIYVPRNGNIRKKVDSNLNSNSNKNNNSLKKVKIVRRMIRERNSNNKTKNLKKKKKRLKNKKLYQLKVLSIYLILKHYM